MSRDCGPLRRFEHNPILTPEQMPFRCYSVFNAGATMFQNKVLLVLRVEKCDRKSYFYTAQSEDGVHFTVSADPIEYPLTAKEERFGPAHRFDMRITKIYRRLLRRRAIVNR